jgi:hypothetical protein
LTTSAVRRRARMSASSAAFDRWCTGSVTTISVLPARVAAPRERRQTAAADPRRDPSSGTGEPRSWKDRLLGHRSEEQLLAVGRHPVRGRRQVLVENVVLSLTCDVPVRPGHPVLLEAKPLENALRAPVVCGVLGLDPMLTEPAPDLVTRTSREHHQGHHQGHGQGFVRGQPVDEPVPRPSTVTSAWPHQRHGQRAGQRLTAVSRLAAHRRRPSRPPLRGWQMWRPESFR